jgi:predicted nucleic acid-binding protein
MKVVDASVGFKMLVTEDGSDRALALLGETLHAPDLYTVEVTSAIYIAETRKRISDAQALLGDFLTLVE